MKSGDEEQIQGNVCETGEDQDDERPAGIANRPQCRRPHVVDCIGDQPQGNDPKIEKGGLYDIGRCLHQGKDRICESKTDEGACNSQNGGNEERHTDRFPQMGLFSGAKILRRQNGRASCESYIKHHKNSQNRSRGTSHCRERFFSGDPPHDQGIDRVVELLEEGTYQ